MDLVCIPAFNEEGTVGGVVRESLRFAERVAVCDDGSTDGTAAEARAAGAHVIEHGSNRGYGAALATLFEFARSSGARTVVTVDADAQHSPAQIRDLAGALERHNVDVVIGSRFLSGGRTPAYRRAGIRVITSASNYGTGLRVSDAQSGFRAYSGAALDLIRPTEPGMSASTQILKQVSDNGLSLAEVPVEVSYDVPHASGQPAVTHGVSVLVSALKLVSIRHPLKSYGAAGLAFLAAGLALGAVFFDAYINEQSVFYGSLAAAIVLFLLGTILLVTAILLFTMANLIRDRP